MGVRGVVTLALAFSAALLGCSNTTEKPSTLPSTRSATPTSPSPADSLPSIDGSISRVVSTYYAAVDRAAETGEGLDAVKALYLPSCAVCVRIDQTLRRFLGRGQHAVAGGHIVVLGGVTPAVGRPGFVVNAKVSTVPGKLVDSRGTTVQSFGATGPNDWVYDVVLQAGTAKIAAATNLGPSS